ncbi:hypothetical protein VTK73DRAFT_1773 [Phialemonium thermophilum]|uniref:Uncharacterized protein n=1 Tax=Phialemonium thermophilum TaxID=223376 RepID=A0ABR3VT01_9PEZI
MAVQSHPHAYTLRSSRRVQKLVPKRQSNMTMPQLQAHLLCSEIRPHCLVRLCCRWVSRRDKQMPELGTQL